MSGTYRCDTDSVSQRLTHGSGGLRAATFLFFLYLCTKSMKFKTRRSQHSRHRQTAVKSLRPRLLSVLIQPEAMMAIREQELIRRRDSERELFYDDIAHVLQNTKKENLLRLTN